MLLFSLHKKDEFQNFDKKIAINGTTKVKEKNQILEKFLSNGYDILITNIQKVHLKP